jgi:hypothetical protein
VQPLPIVLYYVGRINFMISKHLVGTCQILLKRGRGHGKIYITVVINMKNPNALIAMAQVSQNANNPYATFCEYIKYCVYVNRTDTMTLAELREAVGKEFGLYIPHNVMLKCLSYIQTEGTVSCGGHQIKRIGAFDIDSFDRERTAYRTTESALIDALIQYVAKYGQVWTAEYARELLIRVLDRSGLAYDIFLHEKRPVSEISQTATAIAEMEEMLSDDEETGTADIEDQPLFTDSFFVGKFVEELLAGDTIQKEYLRKICAGLMLCVGAYQLPTTGADQTFPQISGTEFFFDTKLLLRFIGCAGKAAVAAAEELVALIQNAGGKIYYYPQTLLEMERAFDNAIYNLSRDYAPHDEEMRLYAASIKNNIAVITAKKASLKDELSQAKIYLKPNDTFTDSERIRFGFDYSDLQQYMRNNLPWDPQVVDNDARSIWETHMRRQGNYNEYCGTSARLPVFVTTNSKLIAIALKFRGERQNTTAIYGWSQNRLPVITDIRLTCRLWSPASQSERMSLLYLSANAVAAKRPTRRYLDNIRELAVQLRENAPEYSGICLPAYFDDSVTDIILEQTHGEENKLNIGSFASSIAELSEWKAKEQEETTNRVITECDRVSNELGQQTRAIIEGAIDENKNKLGMTRVMLKLILLWPAIVTPLFAGISALLSYTIGNLHILWITLLPMALAGVEQFSSSKFVKKSILKVVLPKAEVAFDKRITNNLRKAELPYKDTIIKKVKEQTPLWVECKKTENG